LTFKQYGTIGRDKNKYVMVNRVKLMLEKECCYKYEN